MHSKILPRLPSCFPSPSSRYSRTDVKTIAVGCSHGMITINSPAPPLRVNSERNTDARTFSFVSRSTRVDEIAFWGETFFGDFDGKGRETEKSQIVVKIIYPDIYFLLRLAEFSIFFSAPQPFTLTRRLRSFNKYHRAFQYWNTAADWLPITFLFPFQFVSLSLSYFSLSVCLSVFGREQE